MAKHAHPRSTGYEAITNTPDRKGGKHKARRHRYASVWDKADMSRAKCLSITPRFCLIELCPRHSARNYGTHMAAHSTDSI